MPKIKILTGGSGSGKTEIAVNFGIKLAHRGEKVALVDIDIVNSYFCIRDLKTSLQKCIWKNVKGKIRVVSADSSLSNAELMVVPAEVLSIFKTDEEVIIDVGGDSEGAAVLGRYNDYFKEEEYEMYFVVNTNRPGTRDINDIKEYIHSIEKTSRLKVTSLISNTNMSYATNEDDIIKGDEIVSKLSEELNIPYGYTVCRRDLMNKVKEKVRGDILPIDIYMKPPWR